jgi:hypothetical protein
MKLGLILATMATASAFTPTVWTGRQRICHQSLRASTLDKVDTESSSKSSSSSKDENDDEPLSMSDRIANSGVASMATLAAAAVNAAVSMKSLDAPDVSKSYVALDKTQQQVDEEGLPLVYDKELIEKYWSKQQGALNQRWGYFVGKTVPFLTRLTTLFIRDGKIKEKYIPELSQQARIDLQDLGPTFIKVITLFVSSIIFLCAALFSNVTLSLFSL